MDQLELEISHVTFSLGFNNREMLSTRERDESHETPRHELPGMQISAASDRRQPNISQPAPHAVAI